MKKAVTVLGGLAVVLGVTASAGAWFTGQQLEGVLKDSIAQANRELAKSVQRSDGGPLARLTLVSVERHWFSSQAHYQVQVDGNEFGAATPLEYRFVDHLEHGPWPWSRVKTLHWLPVMALSNIAIERTPGTEAWFARTGGEAPLTAQVAIGYDQSTQSHLNMLPLTGGALGVVQAFSGLQLSLRANQDMSSYTLQGRMGEGALALPTPDGPLAMHLQNVTLDSQGTRSATGFYLGQDTLTVGSTTLEAAGYSAQLNEMVNTAASEEVDGKLAVQLDYAVGQSRIAGQDVGKTRLSVKLSDFDSAASRALLDLYQQTIGPQLMAAAQADQPLSLTLSEADRRRLDQQLAALLAGQPKIMLQPFSQATANGESTFNLTLTLKDPGPVHRLDPQLSARLLDSVDAKLYLSTAMLKDLAAVQARMQGQTDPAAIDRQAEQVSNMVAGMAVMTGYGEAQDNAVVADLHYANDQIVLNGQTMSLQQWLGMLRGGAVGSH